MSVIYRTDDLVTPTTSVLAIHPSGRMRLACRTPGTTPRLVIEEYRKNPNIPESEYDSTDWWQNEEIPVQPAERFVPDVRNRLGRLGAYCTVVSIADLQAYAAALGMRWCALSRRDHTSATESTHAAS